jgi:hypothetical protein
MLYRCPLGFEAMPGSQDFELPSARFFATGVSLRFRERNLAIAKLILPDEPSLPVFLRFLLLTGSRLLTGGLSLGCLCFPPADCTSR